MNSLRQALLMSGVTGLAVFALAAPAGAHVTANPDKAPSDSYYKADFRLPHGCDDGSPTTSFTVRIPDKVVSVHPQAKQGWDVSVTEGELEEPVELHGTMVREGVQEITWTATEDPLPSDLMGEFGVSMKLPPGEQGSPLWFPVIQDCEGDAVNEQTTIPESVSAADDAENPAPHVVLTAAADEGGASSGDTNTPAGARDVAASTASAGSDPGPLTVVALVLGSLGVVLGGAGIALWRRGATRR